MLYNFGCHYLPVFRSVAVQPPSGNKLTDADCLAEQRAMRDGLTNHCSVVVQSGASQGSAYSYYRMALCHPLPK
jgi:hypothetical protein